MKLQPNKKHGISRKAIEHWNSSLTRVMMKPNTQGQESEALSKETDERTSGKLLSVLRTLLLSIFLHYYHYCPVHFQVDRQREMSGWTGRYPMYENTTPPHLSLSLPASPSTTTSQFVLPRHNLIPIKARWRHSPSLPTSRRPLPFPSSRSPRPFFLLLSTWQDFSLLHVIAILSPLDIVFWNCKHSDCSLLKRSQSSRYMRRYTPIKLISLRKYFWCYI